VIHAVPQPHIDYPKRVKILARDAKDTVDWHCVVTGWRVATLPHECVTLADALTKSLPATSRTQHREVMLGHTPFYARLLH
jgi:hypothetical protein